jgi:hypothetical protein
LNNFNEARLKTEEGLFPGLFMLAFEIQQGLYSPCQIPDGDGMRGGELLADTYARITLEHATPPGGKPASSTFLELPGQCPE